MNYSIVILKQSACSYHMKLIWELSQIANFLLNLLKNKIKILYSYIPRFLDFEALLDYLLLINVD